MIHKLLLVALLLSSMVSYGLAHAAYFPYVAVPQSHIVRSDVWNPTILNGPLVTCWGSPIGYDDSHQPIPNPDACHNLCDLIQTITNVIYYMIAFVLWVIVPISFASGGIMYMLAGANPGLESTAKSVLKGAVMGVVIVLCSYIIVFTVVHAFPGLNQYVGGFGGGPACSTP